METLYNIMANAFNDLQRAGPQFALQEDQKITQFQNSVSDGTAVNYLVISKCKWNDLPQPATFDQFYNIFSAYMNQHRTLTTAPNNQNCRINNTNSGRGRGRGDRGSRGGRSGCFNRHPNGRGGRFTQGGGRGGRGGRNFNNDSSSLGSNYGPFRAEAPMYLPSVYRTFSYQQKQEICQAKQNAGWIDADNPPHGYVIDQNTGYAKPNDTMISQLAASINNLNTGRTLPPPPNNNQPPIPPNIETNQAGNQFGRSGQRAAPSDQSSVGMVSINGCNYNGNIYDANGHQLN